MIHLPGSSMSISSGCCPPGRLVNTVAFRQIPPLRQCDICTEREIACDLLRQFPGSEI